MTDTVEFYYSFQSPYSYLALDTIYEIQKKYKIDIIWQPYSAKAAGQQSQNVQIIPDKLAYLFEDSQRYAKQFNLPLTFPASWPENEFDPGRVTRGALVAKDLDVLMEYNLIVFHRIWGLGQNPNDENFINELCEELDVDLGDFLSKLSSSDTRERVKGIYQRGKKVGVFDTPTFVINNNERIYGIDKLAYVEKRIAEIVK